MDFLTEFMRGKVFSICGKTGEKTKFDNDRGEVLYYASVVAAGHQVNVELSGEAEFAAFPVAGLSVRVSGVATRKKGSLSARLSIRSYSVEGDSKFQPIQPDEFFECGRWIVACRVISKKTGSFAGTSYNKIQVQTFGETFEYSIFGNADFFVRFPNEGNLIVRGHFDSSVRSVRYNDQSSKANDLVFVPDTCQIFPIDKSPEKK
jgi:hypothetical protein